MVKFILNNKEVSTDLPKGTLLLDFIRYHQHLSGTKIGCREGDCGACTVLIGEKKNEKMKYHSVTSCLMAIGNVHGKHIVTVEGVNTAGLNFVQQAFTDEGASQCGFCTPGFMVSLAGFSLQVETPTYEKGIEAVNGNICRCTGYKSIERSIQKIADKLSERANENAVDFAVNNHFLPDYFKSIPERMEALQESISKETEQELKLAKFMGGGTDLYVQQHDAMTEAEIHFLATRNQLQQITLNGNTCEMGGAVTVTEMANAAFIQEAIPSLPAIIKLISSTPIRNMATIAGNLVNASPIGDFNILFLALNAQLLLTDEHQERKVALRNFYKGYKIMDKGTNEYVKQISFQLPDSDTHVNFEKVCKRTHLDIASVNSAISIKINEDQITEAGLAVGGVAPIPLFLTKTSEWLKGKPLNHESVIEACALAQTEVTPITDVRGSIAYKRLLMEQLIKAHFIRLFPEFIQPDKFLSA
ncbi:MAG: FAD binding domain-containing protein [Bacteroidetes bacterium]|nr:FAD binding domain-containing protein [Bacteroidota bacterium]